MEGGARSSSSGARGLGGTWEFLDTSLFEIGGTPISVATIAVAILIILGAYLISRIAEHALTRAFKFRGVEHEGTARAAGRLAHYIVLLIGGGIALQTLGIQLGALFATGAIFAVGLGFAMQSIAQNFVSGVILLVERSIKPGDVIEISEGLVRVHSMGIRATIVETRDGENLIVPNSALIQSTVKNYTLNARNYRLRISVGVVYSSDMKAVFDVLRTVASKVAATWGTSSQEPLVVMTDFADSSVNFDVGVWMNDPWGHNVAASQLREAVWWALKESGIVIAFPQLDVHFDSPIVSALETLSQK